ncbi:hypothetical protein K8Z61_08245 [Nocardioides sp. TRM66260-LWL]|uniref:hypothetical protein n=1 Tax=Nocardioides sp. TRM66260-LWL TaxID=2874478 RepID=UPI001CC80DAD|nr:hypothetical protein [Nocardioides sp. TRM66260-LWL]MBZ5734486.1 hypothetical protein [Nocardioides sp. TRM66260-LWL]
MNETQTPDDLPVVRTAADLERLWRRLMEPLGFAAPQVWLLVLERGQCRHATKLEDLPADPTPADLAIMADVLADLADLGDGRDVAFLYARPGGGRRDGDLAWARTLARASAWPVHLAHDTALWVAAPDDLGAIA